MNNAKLASAIAIGAAALLGACQTARYPGTPVGDPIPQNAYPKVTVEGPLARFIAVNTPTVEKTDVLKVTVPVRLLSNPGNPSNIQYRFLFFTSSGAVARGGEMNWRFLNLPPQDQRFLSGNSLDADAVDWRCEIRIAR
ncbi:MAG TPA: DUF1425 domain-containing protein [Phycisphaerales bacterium]|nr:DUF1425 domain-containing protein [Phycisphaerales bacterium]